MEDEFDKVWREVLEEMTRCGWCDKNCKHSMHLFIHVLLRHKNSQVTPEAQANYEKGLRRI